MYQFTIADLTTYDACELSARVAALELHLGRYVPSDELVSMNIWASVTPYTTDLIWALRVRSEGAELAVQFTKYCSERANLLAPEHPNNKHIYRYAADVAADDACYAYTYARSAYAAYAAYAERQHLREYLLELYK
jgi:hypothetical protein